MPNEIRSLDEYVKCVTDIQFSLNCKWCNKETLLFRGQEDKDYKLIPSLGRDRCFPTAISIFDQERNLIELSKFKRPDVFKDSLKPLELLALLQHHGIPTRLLDVTENAFVALYFACCSNKNTDAEVIIFKNNDSDITNYPIINAIADSYKFAKGTIHNLSLFYDDIINQPYFIEQKKSLEYIIKTDKQKSEWIEECCAEPICVYAPIHTEKQQAQQGRYILFPNKINKANNEIKYSYFTSVIDPLKKDDHKIIGRIVIPYSLKAQIMNELKLFGISKESLFCDNIDYVCESIKDKLM